MSTIPCVSPTALQLGCITNFDMFFLVMGFISLVDEFVLPNTLEYNQNCETPLLELNLKAILNEANFSLLGLKPAICQNNYC